MEPDAQALETALEVLTAGCEGQLLIEDRAVPLKYVLDPAGGRMIASVPAAVLHATELVFHVPEENEDALQLLLTAEEASECPATDRWVAYHGEPEHVHWATMWVDSGKHGPWVFDGDALMRANVLAAEETALCKMLNADKGRLAAVCQRFAGVVVPQPMCVGVDARGVHVRARFGVVRVRFEASCGDAASAREAIRAMLAAVP